MSLPGFRKLWIHSPIPPKVYSYKAGPKTTKCCRLSGRGCNWIAFWKSLTHTRKNFHVLSRDGIAATAFIFKNLVWTHFLLLFAFWILSSQTADVVKQFSRIKKLVWKCR